MNILLDTHLLLWALIDDPRLSVQAKNYILNEESIIFYSMASVWEVAIKHMKKPDQMLLNDEEFVSGCKMAGFRLLSITERHIALLKTLRRTQGLNVLYMSDGENHFRQEIEKICNRISGISCIGMECPFAVYVVIESRIG